MNYNRQDGQLTINFNQNSIDWINKHYPIRNWFLMDGAIRTAPHLYEPGLSSEYPLPSLNIQKYELPRFGFPADIFWEYSNKTHEKLIKKFCEHMCDKTQADIYLFALIGRLMRFEDGGYVELMSLTDDDGQILRTVGVQWFFQGCIDEDN